MAKKLVAKERKGLQLKLTLSFSQILQLVGVRDRHQKERFDRPKMT